MGAMRKSSTRTRRPVPVAPALAVAPAFAGSPPSPSRRVAAPAAPGSTPEASLLRAKRLGHVVAPRHLTPSPPVVQRYYGAQDLTKAKGLPWSARVSEDLNLVAIGPQTVYAAINRIEDANKVLSAGSKIVLQAGKKAEFDLEGPADPSGFRAISFADYYEVIPRFNPEVESEGGDLPREVSPEKGETREATAKKHGAYAEGLKKLVLDFEELQKEVQRGALDPKHAQKAGGIASTDASDWYQGTNSWTSGDELRRKVLKLGLNEIAATYLLEGNLKRRAFDLQKLGKSLGEFVVKESRLEDRIALPTDCGVVVGYVVTGGKAVENDSLAANPDVGSNYYTALPKNAANLGWNYHWAGVILKDGGDNVTLESAGGTSLGSLGKASWWMQMYGTRKVDQTFKKQLHLLHVTRNRDMVSHLDESPTSKKAEQQLLEHQKKVLGWDRLDSDQ